MLYDPESQERLREPSHMTLRRRTVDRFSELFGERFIGFFDGEDTDVFFEALSAKIDEEQALYGLPEGYGGESIEERLWALAQIKAILPEGNINTLGDTHNKSLENYIKLALTAGEDPLTLMIFLSLISAKSDAPGYGRHLAEQQLYIWAPIAGVLGLKKLQTEFEERAFRELRPEEFASIDEELRALLGDGGDAELLRQEAEYLAEFIETEVGDEDITIHIDTRPKSHYSIWQKRTAGKEIITDYLGFRIIVRHIYGNEEAAEEACSEVEKIVSELYGISPEHAGRRKDYIKQPKPNGYQSIHLTCELPDQVFGRKVCAELQIRTETMHRRVEEDKYLYQQYAARKPGIGRRSSSHVKKKLHAIYVWRAEVSQALAEKGTYSRSDVVGDDGIFMFNKDANLFMLHSGETVLDGAFRIHSDHASRTIAAYLIAKDGRILVSFDTPLKDGDCIDLVYAPKDSPRWTEDWEHKTRSDVAHQWLKKAKKKKLAPILMLKGKQLIAEEMIRHGWGIRSTDLLSEEQKRVLAEKNGVSDFDALLVEIGALTKGPGRVARILSEVPIPESQRKVEVGKIHVPGLEDCGLRIRYAGCCDAVHAPDVVANWSPRHAALNVHDATCQGSTSFREKSPGLVFAAYRT